MFVYLDESGDTGFKFPSSSRYFVITLLVIDDPLPFHEAVNELRSALGFTASNEFKFYNSSPETRWSFLRMLRRQEFTAHVLVVDKQLIDQPLLRKREAFYNVLVRTILQHARNDIRDALLVLDESVKSKRSKQQFMSYLRQALNTDTEQPVVREIRYHRSWSDNLIQAADMFSGAVYAAYHRGNLEYVEFLRGKIANVWEWPLKTK